jgi:hypothetical protein
MSKEKQFKHGPELREFWRLEKVKQREKMRTREATVAAETSLVPESTSFGGKPQ